MKTHKKHLDREALARLYQETQSLKEMASNLGCSIPTVRKYMLEYNIPFDPYPRRYSINRIFFSSMNDGEASFYWAGFIAANASVFHTMGAASSIRGVEKSYRISVNVALIDKEFLEQMRDALGSTAPVKIETVKQKNSEYTRASLIISSKDLVLDLMRFDILPKKKLTYKIPEWLLVHQDLRHFIRGWIDGLGGFSETVSGYRMFKTHGTIAFLEQLKIVLSKLNLNDSNRNITISKNSNSIIYVNNNDLKKIAHWLYDNCQHFLERKKEVIESIL